MVSENLAAEKEMRVRCTIVVRRPRATLIWLTSIEGEAKQYCLSNQPAGKIFSPSWIPRLENPALI
jgi:hypothetical protein